MPPVIARTPLICTLFRMWIHSCSSRPSRQKRYITQYKKYMWNFACLHNWHSLYAVVSTQEANHNFLADHKVHLCGSQSRKLILKEKEHLIKCDVLKQVFSSKLLSFLFYLLWYCYALRVTNIVMSDFTEETWRDDLGEKIFSSIFLHLTRLWGHFVVY